MNNLTVIEMDAPVDKLQSVLADDMERAGYTLVGRYVAERRYVSGKESVLLFYRAKRKGSEEQRVALVFSGSAFSVRCFTPAYSGFALNSNWLWNPCTVEIANAPLTFSGWNRRAKTLRVTRWKDGHVAWKETGDVEDYSPPLGAYARAIMYEDEKRHDKAAALYARVLKDFEQRLPASDSNRLMLMNHLARSLRNADRFNEAEQYSRQAIEGWEIRGGQIEEGYLGALTGMAMLLCEQRKEDESRKVFAKSRAVAERLYGQRSKALAEYMTGVAGYRYSGRCAGGS